jgi:hypothetical protein
MIPLVVCNIITKYQITGYKSRIISSGNEEIAGVKK